MVSSDHLGPGEEGQIMVTVTTEGKKGPVTKTVQIRSNDPGKPLVILKLKANVLDPFHKGVHEAKEIFRTPCSRCHVEKGLGKSGAFLYQADCLLCHRRGKSAVSISEMKRLTREELEEIIKYGKPDTMMPGFSFEIGGPLTERQINSLVRYIKGR
ncbi:MAG: DUF1573 domain-containing protein [Nitrospirae bacterium]|nr:DUF1573 domain-containing protein [Nitrospirota bacterium]